MSSSPATQIFKVVVITADLLALMYFGGMWITTGSPIPHKYHDPHIVVQSVKDNTHKAATATTSTPEPVFDLASYVADPIKGAKIAAKCKACHTFDVGGPHRTGPNLWGIVNKPIAAADGYSYSSAFQGLIGQKVWGTDSLHNYLENPRQYIAGTKMQFNGIKNPQERADLIAWLATLE